ncbi:MAG: hypothetical protein DMD96_15875 [Candidatus Rokuibacteriota bacterium]|nr:MAG: hypothetical protein DMD96_15875 [Candidatus Rokubacteria bacterium]
MPRSLSLFLLACLAVGLTVGPATGQALRLGAPAPEVAGKRWINSDPLTTQGMRGRVVLVEFWTYG